MILVADKDISLTVTGNGDVLAPHDGIIAIGSGGPYALAAARALKNNTDLEPEEIALQAMKVASEIESDVTCRAAEARLLPQSYLPHLFVGRGRPGMQAGKGVGSPRALTVLSVSKTIIHFGI